MKHTLCRLAAKTAACLLFLFVSFISFDCIESPLEPVGPTYDTYLSVPVFDKVEYFSDFTKKDSLFEFNPSDSTYFYKTSFTTQPIKIDTSSYQLEPNDTTAALGIFDLNDVLLPAKIISATDFGINIGTLPGMPAGTFTGQPIEFIDTSDFNFVGVNTGTLTLTITNTFPFPVSFPDPIILRNNWSAPDDTVRIASYIIPGELNQGASISVPAPIDNKLVWGNIKTDAINFYTPGSGSQITVNSSDGIAVSFRTSGIKADSAFSTIPYQILHPVNNEAFTLDDSTVIRNALFKAGTFSFVLSNNSKITSLFHIKINELFNRASGDTFKVDRTIQGGETYTHNVVMPQMRVTTPGNGLGTHLHYSVDVEIMDSQGQKKLVSKNDVVHAQLQPGQPFVVQYANGRFKPASQSINSGFKSEFDLGKDINKVTAELHFKNMKLNLRLPVSGSNIPFSYQNLVLTAKNSKHNQTQTIAISDGAIDPAQQNQSIDISNEPNINDFTNFCGQFFPDLPDSFFVSGTLTAPTMDAFSRGYFYDIYDTSKVYPTLDLSIPTDLAIINGVLSDVEKDQIKDDVKQSTIRSIIDGTMNVELTNRIPLALKFQMSFLKWDPSKMQSDTTFRISPDTLVKASEVDMFGVATNPRISNISIYLTGAQVNTIANSDSIHIKLYFNTGYGQNSVKFRKDDYIRIRSSVNTHCTVNKP